jgi:hypothetical protein
MKKAKGGGKVTKAKGSPGLTGPGNRPAAKVGVGSRKMTMKGPSVTGARMKMGKPGKRGS